MPPTSRERVRSTTVSKTRCIVERMLSRVLSRLSLVRVTVGYAAMLVVVATTLLILGPRVEDAVVSARGMTSRVVWARHSRRSDRSRSPSRSLRPVVVDLLGVTEVSRPARP